MRSRSMTQETVATITAFMEAAECDLCAKESELVVAAFRTAFPPDSQVCFACLKKLVLVDHKHQTRRAGKRAVPSHTQSEKQ